MLNILCRILVATLCGLVVCANDQVPFVMPTEKTTSQPSLADLLTVDSSLSIFFSYARELELSAIFADSTQNLTLLAPTNKAVMSLARKPHQGPSPQSLPDEVTVSEEEYDNASKGNVRRWVSAHIIPESIPVLEPRTYKTMLEGRSVSIISDKDSEPSAPAWKTVILENDIHITSMKEAENGILYVIDGTITVD